MPTEFLNSKSMLTPGAAGALVMVIANAFGANFSLPLNWTALILAFLVGLLVFADKKTAVWQRILLYLLNSLFIFAIAVGSNTIGDKVTSEPTAGLTPTESGSRITFFKDWFPDAGS